MLQVYQRLQENEIHELDPMEQLELISALISIILGGDIISDKQEDAQKLHSKIYQSYRSKYSKLQSEKQKLITEEEKQKLQKVNIHVLGL